MKFPCELLAEPYLAQLRIEVARNLKQLGYTQTQSAELLQVSQPVISSYLKKSRHQEDLPQVIISQAMDVAKEVTQILHNRGLEGTSEAINTACHQCKVMRQSGPTCIYHKSITSNLGDDCTSCLTQKPLIELQNNKEGVLNELNDLLSNLRGIDNFYKIIPEVGMQIINSITDPNSMSDIAAFPGRIIKRSKNTVLADAPTFGGSETTSQLLLDLQSKQFDVRTIAAIKTSDWLLNKLDQEKVPFLVIKGFEENMSQKIGQLFFDHSGFVIAGMESIGYESISYICTASTQELHDIILNILN